MGSTAFAFNVNFTLFSGGQLLTTDAPVKLSRSQQLGLSNVSYDANYNNGSGSATDNKRNQPAGAIQWTMSGSGTFSLAGRQSMYCLTPTEFLADNQQYLVYRTSQYGGVNGTPPPHGAGFIPGTFAPFNASAILNAYANHATNSAVSAGVQTLLWDFGYSGVHAGTGIQSTNFSVPNFANYTAYANTVTSLSTSALNAGNKQSFLLYIPVVSDGKGGWSFNTGRPEDQNPASQIFIQADPVPEPATLALALASLGAAVSRRRRRA